MTSPYSFASGTPNTNTARTLPPQYHDPRQGPNMTPIVPSNTGPEYRDTPHHPEPVRLSQRPAGSPHSSFPRSYNHSLGSPPRTPGRHSAYREYDSSFHAEPGVTTGFIEAVAQSMGLTSTDEDYRSSLQSVPMLATGMSRGHLQLHIYQTALLFAILKECRALADTNRTDRTLMADLHVRLEDTFSLTQEQRMNVRLVAGEMLLDTNRVRYVRMNIDVEVKLQEKQKDLRLFNIFGNLSRQRVLTTTIRRTCSSLRNAYREMLRDSVIGSDTQTLDDFVCNVVTRFVASSGRHSLGHAMIAHVALLRRFALENPQILDRVGEDDEDDEDHQPGQGTQGDNTSVSRSADGQPEEGSRPSSAMSIGQPQRGKKRKRNPTAPTQRGQDFWSMVDKWFAARMHPGQLGTSWSSPGWTKYIEETLERDRARFKSDANVNPYLDNFTGAGGDGDDNTGSVGVPGGLVGAIGSMANILEHL